MNLIARAYDLQMPLERSALAAAVELAAVGPGDRLLDVATGTGGLLRELARRGARPAEVVGVDLRRPRLARAAAQLPEVWRLIAADARRLPFADARFDVVTAGYLLHLLDAARRAAVLGEIARVVRPGGRVATITVGSRRALSRRLLSALPRSSGLRPLDPTSDLAAAALTPVRGAFVTAGWPSWCLLAMRAAR